MGSHRAERPRRGMRAVVRRDRGASTARHRSGRTTRRAAVRSAPVRTILGVALVAVAGAGAAAFQPPAASGTVFLSSGPVSQPGNGTDAVGFTDTGRALALSRDSERQAVSDAADERLQAATEQQAKERNAALKSLGRAAEKHALQLAKNKWHLPTTGYHLTARFGMAGGLWSSNHTGLDFATATGTPIVAVAKGRITDTGWGGAYGNRTIETLPDGTELWYCHQNVINVRPGESVSAGQQIGEVGATGNTTGPHLHLEVRPGGGDPVDPFQALVFHGLHP